MTAPISTGTILAKGVLRRANVLGLQLIVDGPRDHKLGRFLRMDTGDSLLLKRYNVLSGRCSLQLTLDDGGLMRPIYGLTGINTISVLVREENGRNHKKIKVLYGWDNDPSFGILKNARLKYVLSERSPTGKWQLCRNPKPLGGLSEQQEITRQWEPTYQAVTQGLGNRVLKRKWRVHQLIRDGVVVDGRVQIKLNGDTLVINGFKDQQNVFAVITEERDKIIARFYKDNKDAKEGAVPQKTVVISERIPTADGQLSRWQPLFRPRIIALDPSLANSNQHVRLAINRLKEFLLDDLAEGFAIEIEPRTVYSGGRISFGIDRAAKDVGGVLRLCGYKEYEQRKLPGLFMVKGDIKLAFFWPDEAAKQNGDAPIFPQGQIVAQKDLAGKWQIKWGAASEVFKLGQKETERYERYLFGPRGERLYDVDWRVCVERRNDCPRKFAYKNIRGGMLKVGLSSTYDYPAVSSVTREIAGAIKLVEFWPSNQAKEVATSFAARFIAIRNKGRENGRQCWEPFWSELDDVKKFKRLIKRGELRRERLNAIAIDLYLSDKYNQQMLALVDAFSLFLGD